MQEIKFSSRKQYYLIVSALLKQRRLIQTKAGAYAGFQKSQSKLLNKFPVQPYLGYFRYELTRYQFFQIYYYYYYIIIIIILLIILSLLLLLLFLLKSWSVVGLWGFRFHQLAFKPSHKEVLLLTCGRLLPTHLLIQVSSQLINTFLTLFLTAEAQRLHGLSGAAAIYLGSKSFFRSFEEKLTGRVKLKRLSFIAQFNIDFLLAFTGCRNVLRKKFALDVSRQIIVSQCLSHDMIDGIRDALCKELFCFAVVIVSFLWYYLHE